MTAGAAIQGFHLSPIQERGWFLGQARGRLPHGACAYLIAGKLDADRLGRTLGEAIARHEILRTRFVRPAGTSIPVQVVAGAEPPPLERRDLSVLGEPERQAAAAALWAELRQRHFEIEQGPTLHLCLVRLGPEQHRLFAAWCGLCDDLPGFESLVDEAVAGYLTPGGEASAEPLQYADVAAWLREILRSDETEAERAFWSALSGAASHAAALPAEPVARDGAPEQEAPPAIHELRFERELKARLEVIAGHLGSEPRTLLLTSWQALLWRLTGERNATVAVAMDGRVQEELVGAQGPFTRYLPIAAELEGRCSFAAAVGRVARLLEQASALQDYFSWTAPGPTGSSAPPSPPFGFEFHRTRARSCGGASIRLVEHRAWGEEFQVLLSVLAAEGDLATTLVYDPAHLAGRDAERVGRHWLTLLAGALSAPETPLEDLELLAEADRYQLLVCFNDTASRFAAPDVLHHLWEARAATGPGDAAATDGRRTWSAGELEHRANRLAHRLRRLGVSLESPVAILAERCLEAVAAHLAVLKAGGVAVPLDPYYPPERLDWLLEDSGAKVLIAPRISAYRPATATRAALALEDSCDGEPETTPGSAVCGDGAAFVIYTSGSTGRPKGVLLTHAGLANRLLWGQSVAPLSAADRVLQLASQSFDFAIWEMLAPLAFGAVLVLAAPASGREPAAIVRQIRESEVTVAHFVPSLLRLVLEEPELADCRSLRLVFAGGEALPLDVAERFQERSHARLCNQYGPTEASIDVTWWSCSGRCQGAVPIGHPISNTRIYLLDAGGRPVAIGVPGELWIGGHGLARGYLGRAELTAERFLPDPFGTEAGARLYRTGDLGRYGADGRIVFLGRIDRQVKIRGYRVEPGEVEEVLGRHPAVREAAARAQEHAPGLFRLVAYVVARDAAAPTAEELRAWLAARLPEFMVPAAFVSLVALPRLPSGKLDPRALPSPDLGRGHSLQPPAPPRNECERLVAEIWAGVLGVAEVGIDDNFFALGGDSIISMQISARARHAGLRLTPRLIFEHPTIAELAPLLAMQHHGADAAPEQEPAVAPLTPIQCRFFAQGRPEPQHFNQPVLLEVWRGLEPRILAHALAGLLARHDALRLRFQHRDRGWEQRAADPDGGVPLAHLDLSGLPAGRLAAVLAAAAECVQRTLDLSAGPLVRAALFEVGVDEPRRLLLAVHHLAVDAVSWRILLEDLETACRQVARGEAIALPAATASYRRWACHLADRAAAGAWDDELPYWLDERRRKVATLPRDHAAGANGEGSSRTVTVAISAEETAALLEEVPGAYRTRTEEVLLAALAGAVSGWTGERTVLIDVEGHGREEDPREPNLSRTIGWFTSVHPLLLELPPERDPGTLLKSVKEQVRAVPDRGLGYGVLRYLRAETALRFSGLPEAEIGFNYLGRIGAIDGRGGGLRLFAPAPEASGRARSPRAARAHLLDIDGCITGGKLEVHWVYGEQVHTRETIAAAAGAFVAGLRHLIAHCRAPEAGGYTPSDFPDVALDQGSLDDLLAELRE